MQAIAQPPEAWFPLRPHPIQRELWTTKTRFVCLPAGRGSGKTEIAKRRLVMYTGINRDLTGERPPEAKGLKHLYAYLGPTRPWVKRVSWDHLKSLMPREWIVSVNETDLVIKTIFNSELHCIGMDTPARFEGDQWDGVVEDESSDQQPNIHLSVRPAITTKLGWWWKIGIPKRHGRGAVEYRRMCMLGRVQPDGKYLDPDTRTYSWPSWDILPAKEVESMRQSMDPKDFREQVGGEWEAIGGAAFHQFDKAVHVRPCVFDPTRPLFVSCDFNVTPMAWILCQANPANGGMEVIDEIWLSNTNTTSTLDTLWQRYGDRQRGGWIFYGDAASKQRHTAASYSDYTHILNDKRFKANVIIPDSNPRIKDRLASCNALLRNAADQVRCHIDPKCEHLIKDLENRGLEKDGSPIDTKKTGAAMIGHISDAFGYIVHERYPCTVIDVEEGSTPEITIHIEDD